MESKRNILWINLLKGICMISVYLLHAEVYTGLAWVKSYGFVLQPFYVNAFFFVSGYLLFRKWLSVDGQLVMNRGGCWESLNNLFFRLILPTIIFASILYIPKILFHNGDVSVGKYFYDVWGGISFWFTSALLVSQFVLLTLFLSKNRNIWFYLLISVGLFVFAYWLSRVEITPFPWYYKSGLAATLFLTLGGVYQRYELEIDSRIGRIGWWIVALVYFNLMIWDFDKHSFDFALMSVKFNFMGMLMTLIGIVFVVGLCKMLNSVRLLEYIGQNSILFYFCSGVVPASLSTLFGMFVEMNYWWVVVIAFVALCVSCVIVMFVNRYFSFLLDLRLMLGQFGNN